MKTPQQASRDTYRVWCKCANCGYSGNLDIPKGRPAPVPSVNGKPATCPVCECRSLWRDR